MAMFQIYDLTGAIWLMLDKLLKTEKWYNVIINENQKRDAWAVSSESRY